MLTLQLILSVLAIHFVADFLLQTRKMATNKSKSIKWLTAHVGVYTIPWIVFGWKFALLNGALHWVIDFCTSRATTYLYKKEEWFWFFAVIGFDQLLHQCCLLGSLTFLR